MGQKTLMSRKQYADHRGCTRSAVQKALATGRIRLAAGTDLIDPEEADAAWLRNTDVSRRLLVPGRR